MVIKMTEVRLGQIANIFTGKCNAQDAVDDGIYPLFDRSGEVKKSDKYFADCEAIIVPGESTTFIPRYYKGKFNLHQRAYCINPHEDVNGVFLYYLIKANSPYFFSVATGATVASLRLNNFLKMKLNLPLRQAQDKIANILSTYDKLIENNNKRIAILEQEVEEIYKEWFVRFRFPGYEKCEFENGVPKGWIECRLRDVAVDGGIRIKNNEKNKYEYYLPIDFIPSKSMSLMETDDINNAESSLIAFEKGQILMGAMRPYFHKVLLAPFSGITRSTCFVIVPKETIFNYYLYMTIFQKSSIDFATTVSVGSTMPYVRWKDFSRIKIIWPSEAILRKFNLKSEPLFQFITEMYFINSNLKKQRDLLLPRLMSGKLEVK